MSHADSPQDVHRRRSADYLVCFRVLVPAHEFDADMQTRCVERLRRIAGRFGPGSRNGRGAINGGGGSQSPARVERLEGAIPAILVVRLHVAEGDGEGCWDADRKLRREVARMPSLARRLAHVCSWATRENEELTPAHVQMIVADIDRIDAEAVSAVKHANRREQARRAPDGHGQRRSAK